MDEAEMAPFLDENGVFYVQVTKEYEVLESPANPAVVENENN